MSLYPDLTAFHLSLTSLPGMPRAARPKMSDVGLAARILGALIDLEGDREYMVAAFLDDEQRLLAVTTLGVGEPKSVHVLVRDVFRPAILLGALSFVLGHNHPSGNPEPSAFDVATTRQTHGIGELLGIELLDHVVLGRSVSDMVSLRQRGLGVPEWEAAAHARDEPGARVCETRAASLRAAVWRCPHCNRGQLQRQPRCRYCGGIRPCLGTVEGG